eukprot:1261276-Rhodomonas_salina.2
MSGTDIGTAATRESRQGPSVQTHYAQAPVRGRIPTPIPAPPVTLQTSPSRPLLPSLQPCLCDL